MKTVCILIALSAPIFGQEDSPKPPTIESLQKELAAAKDENQKLIALVNEYQQQFFRCLAEGINQKVLKSDPPNVAPSKKEVAK